jgi:hypothetical protein
MNISVLSVEFLTVEVTALTDPTAGSVEFAFTTTGRPGPSDWVAGSWDGDPVETGPYHRARARVLVGPGYRELPLGSVAVWVRTSSAPENIVKVAGSLDVS